MSLALLVVAAALVTHVSRATSLVLLPTPQGWLAQMVERLPAPLFAGLGAATLLVAPRRSLGLTLIAGLLAHSAAVVAISVLC